MHAHKISALVRTARVVVAFLIAPWLSNAAIGSSIELSSVLVDVSWLQKYLGHPDLVVLDARSRAAYGVSHIDGAVSLPGLSTFAGDDVSRMLIPISRAKSLFSSAGISRDKTVVIYDGGGVSDAPRVFWVLEVYGHNKVAVLDGGFDAWTRHSMSVSDVAVAPTPGEFIPAPNNERLATKLATRLALNNPSFTLIDSRAADLHAGTTHKTPIGGHIPQSINVPASLNLSRTAGVARFRSKTDLERLYAFVGSRKTVVYCDFGEEATLTYLALRYLNKPVSIYDGSWSEWSLDPQTPKVLAKSPLR